MMKNVLCGCTVHLLYTQIQLCGEEHFKGTDVAWWLRCEDNTLSNPSGFRFQCYKLHTHVYTLIHLPGSLKPVSFVRLFGAEFIVNKVNLTFSFPIPRN